MEVPRRERMTLWPGQESPLKKEPFYIERDEEKRKAYDEEIANIPPDADIAYIYECGVSRHMSREYGRAKKGERVYLSCHGCKYKRLNIIAGYLRGRLLCPTKYDWSTNSEWFNEWFEWYLCPILKLGSIIVLDNASFHKKADIIRIAASYGHRAIFLPPYSPDKNPIEKKWANLKNWLRIHSKKYSTISEAVSAYFMTE